MTPITERLSAPSLERRRSHERKRHSEFLRGPIPIYWLAAASRLPGKAPLAVALVIWFAAGLTGRRTGLAVGSALLDRFKLAPRTAHDGIEKLEAAGLVTVMRRRGATTHNHRRLQPQGNRRPKSLARVTRSSPTSDWPAWLSRVAVPPIHAFRPPES